MKRFHHIFIWLSLIILSGIAIGFLLFPDWSRWLMRLLLLQGAVMAVNEALFSLTRPTATERGGYKLLTPSLTIWIVALASIGIALLFAYNYLIVGSARVDADQQMLALRLLIIGFGGGGAALLWSIYKVRVAWNDQGIWRRTMTGNTLFLDWEQISHLEYLTWTGYYNLCAADGRVLRFEPYYNGSDELVEEVVLRGFASVDDDFE